jgi:hypothetical protein
LACVPSISGQTIPPTADGTIIDGGARGPFDGVPDFADWSFNQSSSEGAITLSASVEQRIVWEFNLTVAPSPPITAYFSFAIRGAARFPAHPAQVLVYAYPADLIENLADFSAEPSILVAEKLVVPFSPLTTYVVDVSSVVNERLSAGAPRIGFRFRIDDECESGQAFFDALDSEPATKPFLTLQNRVPGDFDADGDVDSVDLDKLDDCMSGPGLPVFAACRVCDGDLDLDVDLEDAEVFLGHWEEFYQP